MRHLYLIAAVLLGLAAPVQAQVFDPGDWPNDPVYQVSKWARESYREAAAYLRHDLGVVSKTPRLLRPYMAALLQSTCTGASPNLVAAAATRAAIADCYTDAVDDDTITVPTGTITDWTTNLAISKAITLQGGGCTLDGDGIPDPNGTCLTKIQDNMTTGSEMTWFLVADKISRMTGFELIDGTRSYPGTGSPFISVRGVNTDTGAGRRFRFDHNYANLLAASVMIPNSVEGVADHNYIRYYVPAGMGYVKGSNWNGTQGSASEYGDGSWAEAENFGSKHFFFYEDNIFHFDRADTLENHPIDGQAGARYVVRNNTFIGNPQSLASHGEEASRERSGRAFEVYNNTFTCDTSPSSTYIAYFRGGVGLIHDNTTTGCGSVTLRLLHNRSNELLARPFGGSDGRNPVDANTSGISTGTVTCVAACTIYTLTDSAKIGTWTNDQYVGYTIRKTSGNACSGSNASASVASGVVTVTCNGHGYVVGTKVSIFNSTDYSCNAYYTIATVPNANQFTASNPYASGCAGTVKVTTGLWFSEITDVNATTGTLTFRDTFYDDTLRSPLAFANGDEYEINQVNQAIDMPGAGAGADLNEVLIPTLPGAWLDQTITAWHEWNNTREAGANINFTNGHNSGGTFGILVAGTHYKTDTQYPGYTEYTYPHPLTVGSNLPPTVDAGQNQAIESGATATLSGSGSDDGLPVMPGMVTYTWTQVDMNCGVVTFANANAAQTTATTASDDCVTTLQLEADDGEYAPTDTMTVTVAAAPAGMNMAPTVDLVASFTTRVGTCYVLTPAITTLSDDGLPSPGGLTTTWSVVTAPGNTGGVAAAFTDASDPNTCVRFSFPGIWVLRLTVSDAAPLSDTDDVTVTVRGPITSRRYRFSGGR